MRHPTPIKRGFSLVELLVSISILLLMAGGLTYTLSKVTQGSRSASAGSDLSALARSVFKLVQTDIYKAQRGLSDLNMYQFHYGTDRAYADEPIFYGICGLESGSNSAIELQWFGFEGEYEENGTIYHQPYHISAPAWVMVNPDWEGSQSTDWPGAIEKMMLLSALPVDPNFADLQPGDYVAIYSSNMLWSEETNKLEALQQNYVDGSALWDETLLQNGAILTQIASINDEFVPADYVCLDGTGFQSAVVVTFGGSVMANSLGANMPLNPYTKPTDPCLYTWFNSGEPENTKQYTHPKNAWILRKLGEKNNLRDDHHRVRYELLTNGTNNTLVRTENGTQIILASNVVDFQIQVGLDVTDTTTPWDGSVGLDETTNWVGDLNEIAGDDVSRRAILGKHAVAIKLQVTFESTREDEQDTTIGKKEQTFEQLIRLRNTHLPMRNI
jgi:prepilin-type N-terminal cleavage/methylation domain-containing protein